jgi:heme oxygenase
MAALFDGKLGNAAYIRLLQGHHALYADWERRHASWFAGGLTNSGWQYQSRLLAIESDLRSLGARPTLRVEETMASTQEISPPSSDTEEVSWGSLYVIEGSALGGQIIARKLLLEFPGHLHRFFRLSHGGNRPTWKVFQGLMANQLSDAGSRRTIALQARATFRVFQRMLDAVMR